MTNELGVLDELEFPNYVMVNCDGKYWCKGRNTKNYKRAVVDTYYNFYETLSSMYYEYWQYDRHKWNAIGIIPYTVMIEAEKLRRESEELYSEYLNQYIGIYFINRECYETEFVDGDKIKLIWSNKTNTKKDYEN